MSAEQSALTLAEEYGLPVFPCRPDKKPYTQHGLKDATRDIEQIATWWQTWPDALIGVPTGAASKLLVVDIDPAGEDWYREYFAQLAPGRIHKTQRGHHLLYTMPDAPIRNSAGKLAPGIDVRGEGGYAIWWPALGHETTGDLGDIGPVPDWLTRKLSTTPERTAPTSNGNGRITEGGRNDAMTRLAGKMRHIGATQDEIENALIVLNERCDPPLGAAEIERIAGSVSRYAPANGKQAEAELDNLEGAARHPLDWRAMAGTAPPSRDWAVDHWLPMGHAALLAGAGGIGKTLLAQTLGTCLALGYEYVDVIPKPRKVLFWAGEDEETELWRRQLAICDWLNVKLEDLADRFIVESYIGRDITLAVLAYGQLTPTTMMTELQAQIGDYRADYVFVDSVARVFGGSENDRHQVTTFVSWLTAACEPTGAGICLLGHPGKGAGSEWSGSTAWEASVRSRLYLGARLPNQSSGEADEAGDESIRYLCRRKANYSAKDFRKFNYTNGVLVPESVPVHSFTGPRGEFAQDTVLRALRSLKDLSMYGNTSTRSPDYLPRLASQYDMLDSLSERQFAAAMRELIIAKRISSQQVGQYQNRTPKLGLVECTNA